MGQSVNDTTKLVKYIEVQSPVPLFYLNRFAADIVESPEENVLIELKIAGKKMAPFVMPMEQGKAIIEQGEISKTVKPAYVKMKNVVTPRNALRRKLGEDPQRLMSPSQRLQLSTMNQFVEHDGRLQRRCEWMAARAFQNGGLVIEYEDSAPIALSFGRDPSLTKVLDGGAGNEFWVNVDTKIVDQIEGQNALMVAAPGGVAASDMVMPLDVWKCFKINKQVLDLLDTNIKGQDGEINRGLVMPNGISLRGTLPGGLRVWVDTRGVELEDGSSEALQPAKEVLFLSDSVSGAQYYGAIMDVSALYAVRSYPKFWDEDDPGVRMALTQSAPIVAPGNPNATSKMVVLE